MRIGKAFSWLSGSLAAHALAISCVGAQAARPATSVKASRDYPDLQSFFALLPDVKPIVLDDKFAVWLASMPLSCLSHPHNSPATVPYVWEPSFTPIPDLDTRRAFYGCFDWHSAVNSTWTLVRLLKDKPTLATAPLIRQKLNEHLGALNIAGEVEFFSATSTFELPYGYAWLLRVQYELRSWNDPDAKRWAANIEPLAALMSARMIEYMKGLDQPVRSGVHPNTAMAMVNAFDYATSFDPALERSIRENAERFFLKDTKCPTASEPGMSDFHSPCLMEAELMSRLLPRDVFLPWLDKFLAPIHSIEFRPVTELLGPEWVENPNSIAARSHITGLSFVRGKSMGEIAKALPPGDPRIPVLRRLATMQAAKGFEGIGAVGYDGSHYYGTAAMMYFVSN